MTLFSYSLPSPARRLGAQVLASLSLACAILGGLVLPVLAFLSLL